MNYPQTTVRALVRRLPMSAGTDPNSEQWYAIAYTQGVADGPDHFEATFRSTHADALRTAHEGAQRIAQRLMDEVHASRAARRTGRDRSLAASIARHPAGKARPVPAAAHVAVDRAPEAMA